MFQVRSQFWKISVKVAKIWKSLSDLHLAVTSIRFFASSGQVLTYFSHQKSGMLITKVQTQRYNLTDGYRADNPLSVSNLQVTPGQFKENHFPVSPFLHSQNWFALAPLLSWTFPSRSHRTQPSLFCFQGWFCFRRHSIYYTYIRAAAAPRQQEHHTQCQTKCKFG